MYETWLIPYLEGTLDAERRRELEARLADDPRLASELGALRRAEPRLRAVAAHLRRSEAARSAPAPLWPGLRGRLDARPARPLFAPAFWGTSGGLCAAGLLVLAVLRGPALHPSAPDRKAARESRNAPLIVSHPDDAVGTGVAERLQARDRRVAAAERAADAPLRPLVASRPAPAPALPAPAAVAVPAAPPLPAAPPVRVAKREPDTLPPFPIGLPPAPTHSPPPPAPAFAPAPPTHSPAPGQGPTEVQAGVARSAPATAPASEDARQAKANDSSAAEPAPMARQYLPINGSVRVALPAAAPLRQRLEQALTPPLYGTDEGGPQEQKLLRAAREGAAGGVLRAALEAEAAETQPAASARLLATLDEDEGDWEGAAARWRRVARRPDAVAEDWFRLARAETRLGNADAARQAYAQALRPGPYPLSAAHRATAVQNAP